MKLCAALVLGMVAACSDHGGSAPPIDAPTAGDAVPPADTAAPAETCPVAEILFTQATGCANDGSVEFCIPAGDAALAAELAAIEPAITCAEGGGRARCFDTPGQLLCFYPTAAPQQCVAPGGAMTDAAWQDMCELAALPAVTAIVHTIFE